MVRITFDKEIDDISLDDCLKCYENGVVIIMDEGSKVTFQVEER